MCKQLRKALYRTAHFCRTPVTGLKISCLLFGYFGSVKNFNGFNYCLSCIINTKLTAVYAKIIAPCSSPFLIGIVIIITGSALVSFCNHIFCFFWSFSMFGCNSVDSPVKIRMHKNTETIIPVCQCIICTTSYHYTRSLTCQFLNCIKLCQKNFVIHWHI